MLTKQEDASDYEMNTCSVIFSFRHHITNLMFINGIVAQTNKVKLQTLYIEMSVLLLCW